MLVSLLLAVVAAGLAQCASGPAPEPAAKALAGRIGWMHIGCLAIDNPALEAGTPLTIVRLDKAQTVIEATLQRPIESGGRCPPLLADRGKTNSAAGLTYYEVALPVGQTLELGIGVVRPAARTATAVDVDGDGMVEQFTHCATAQGISFGVWKGAPYATVPLWSGYYYVGYDEGTACPSN